MNHKNEIIKELMTIYDPEIPVNIYDLGLIYEINTDNLPEVYIKMTLTSPACPVGDDIIKEIHEKLVTISGINNVKVDLTFDPPWSKESMSDEALLQLGLI